MSAHTRAERARDEALGRERSARVEAEALYAAAQSIGGQMDLDARLERVLDAALGLSGALQARIALADPDTGEIEIVASRGLLVETVGMRQPAGTGLAGEVLRR